MPFTSKDPNNKSDLWKYNKDGTPRKHGNLVQVNCKLKPETIEAIEQEARLYRVSKSEMIRTALEYSFRDNGYDSSIVNDKQKRLKAMENDILEKKLAENGNALSDILSEMKCIGRNLNQITKKINQGYNDQSLSNEVQELYALKSEIETKISDFVAWMIGFYGEDI